MGIARFDSSGFWSCLPLVFRTRTGSPSLFQPLPFVLGIVVDRCRFLVCYGQAEPESGFRLHVVVWWFYPYDSGYCSWPHFLACAVFLKAIQHRGALRKSESLACRPVSGLGIRYQVADSDLGGQALFVGFTSNITHYLQ